jgi:hypothetical protein
MIPRDTLAVGPPMPDKSMVITQTKRDTLVFLFGVWGMRLKLIKIFCHVAKSEIQFRISNIINQNILSSFYLVKKWRT